MLAKNLATEYILLFISGFLEVEIVTWLIHWTSDPIMDFAVGRSYSVQLSLEKLSTESVWVKRSEQGGVIIRRKAIVVTPTYQRKAQIPELVRIAQALYPVRKYIKEWIVVEEEYTDSMNELDKEDYEERRKVSLKKVLDYFQIPMKFLFAKKQVENMPMMEKIIKGHHKRKHKPRPGKGLNSRRAALEYLLQENELLTWDSGVLYWVDDDNVYDSEIFTWSENITTVGIWPVSAMRYGV